MIKSDYHMHPLDHRHYPEIAKNLRDVAIEGYITHT